MFEAIMLLGFAYFGFNRLLPEIRTWGQPREGSKAGGKDRMRKPRSRRDSPAGGREEAKPASRALSRTAASSGSRNATAATPPP